MFYTENLDSDIASNPLIKSLLIHTIEPRTLEGIVVGTPRSEVQGIDYRDSIRLAEFPALISPYEYHTIFF
jgi:hypothetical protein